MKQFKFDIGQTVTIQTSGEQGRIVGRAEYDNSADDYLIRYTDGTGCAVQKWWTESAIA